MRKRNSAKAIIIRNNEMLLTKNKDTEGIFYLLPGGGQEPFEDLHNTLIRECKEEINADIEIKDIIFIRDYIGKNHEFYEEDSDFHQTEFMFECGILDIKEGYGSNLDDMQIGIEWIDLNRLNDIRIYPSILKKVIKKDGTFKSVIYLGDTN